MAIEFDLDANYDQATLLKNGVNSVAGKAAEYLPEMANGRKENVRSAITGNFTLTNYLEEKHIPGAIRLYLLCEPIQRLSDDSDSGKKEHSKQ